MNFTNESSLKQFFINLTLNKGESYEEILNLSEGEYILYVEGEDPKNVTIKNLITGLAISDRKEIMEGRVGKYSLFFLVFILLFGVVLWIIKNKKNKNYSSFSKKICGVFINTKSLEEIEKSLQEKGFKVNKIDNEKAFLIFILKDNLEELIELFENKIKEKKEINVGIFSQDYFPN
ncbi:MAG: hypothetical protein QW273_02250, partial [Candidatus Pacearchaeota archaeon]